MLVIVAITFMSHCFLCVCFHIRLATSCKSFLITTYWSRVYKRYAPLSNRTMLRNRTVRRNEDENSLKHRKTAMTHSVAINSTITKETEAMQAKAGSSKNEIIQSKEQRIDPIPFFLGTVVLTQGINILCEGKHEAMDEFVKRHALCDWGTTAAEDGELNNEATHNGERIMSQYDFEGTTLWIVTDHDRRVTTILLPSEY
ncbi:hypothetical protein VSAL_p840_34 (plasmid) [Aliivibrio salmonicida LFI1238]|uniref:Plasmid related protein n=2 Tax=Aliivibrio salmonicida TaxID=40269 RepID=B6ET05_ALISL|nr:hypothetical protein VSAL_p840_34 [Aliivibrio salmonicida LFI1238]